jgi:hypothetical protein
MRIRLGFVSNSSSSSFIVANSGEPIVKISFDIDLERYSDRILHGENDLKSWEKHCGCNDDYPNQYHDKMIKALNAGKTIYIGSFSSEGDGIEMFLCEHGISHTEHSPDLEVIEGDGGY